MKKYVFIVMLSIMSAGHAMNFDLDSEENFPPLEKTRTTKRQQNRRKQSGKDIKKDKTLHEASDCNVNNASKPMSPDDSLMLSPQFLEEMQQTAIYLPHKSDLWSGLDPHFCSHFGRALCEKLYGNYEFHEKPLSRVLSDVDEIMKKYADYMKSTQGPEWQIALRLKTAQRLIMRSVFRNHKDVANLLEAMLHENNSKDHNDNEDIDYQAQAVEKMLQACCTYSKDYPVVTYQKIFDGSRLEAGIEFDVPW